MATIVDVLNNISDGKWQMQLIKFGGALIGSKDKVRPEKHTELTIATDIVCTEEMHRNSGKVGIVIWVDRDAFNKAIDEVDQ